MKLTDVNLLLYAVDKSSPHHETARSWFEERLSGTETFAFNVSDGTVSLAATAEFSIRGTAAQNSIAFVNRNPTAGL